MLIVLTGQDDYRRLEKQKAICAVFAQKHPSSEIGRIDGAAAGAFESLRECAARQSMFDAARLVCVDRAWECEEKGYTAFLKAAAAIPGVTIVLSDGAKPPKAIAALAKGVQMQEFEFLAGAPWDAYVALKAKESGVVLDADAKKLLAAAFVKNTWGLVTELGKLRGVEGNVSRGALDYLRGTSAPEFWPLVNALRGPAPERRVSALEYMLAADAPQKLFYVLAYQIGDLPRMAAYDQAIKSGKLDYEEALTDLAIR